MGLGSLFLCLGITLLNVGIVGSLSLGERFVSDASDCVALEFKLGGLGASIFDILDGPALLLDVIAVEEVGDGDVAIL